MDKWIVAVTLVLVFLYFIVRMVIDIAKMSKYPLAAALRFAVMFACLFLFVVGLNLLNPYVVVPSAIIGILMTEANEEKVVPWLVSKFARGSEDK